MLVKRKPIRIFPLRKTGSYPSIANRQIKIFRIPKPHIR